MGIEITREALAFHMNEGQKLIGEGKLTEAQTHYDAAQTIKSALTKAKEFETLGNETAALFAKPEPQRPTLPGVGAGAVANGANPASDTTKATGRSYLSEDFGYQQQPEVSETEKAERENIAHTFFIAKQGPAAEEHMVKTVLKDLHGSDYESKYYDHIKAYRKFLRFGENKLNAKEQSLIKSVILTPKAVKIGLAQGIESLGTYKAALMTEAADSAGAATVPVDQQLELISRVNGLTVVRPRARVQNTIRDRVDMPKQTGGNSQYRGNVRVYSVDEQPTGGAANTFMTFGTEGLEIHTYMATVPLSKNMLEDSALDLETLINDELTEALSMDEDNRFLTSTGVGSARGILPGGTMPTVNGSNYLVYSKSLSASALTWDGLVNATFAIDAQYRQNCVWIANKATYNAIANLKNAGGNNYWQPFQYVGGQSGGGAGMYSKLLGYPVLEQESMPVIASGNYPLLFCDLKGYRIVDRIGMTINRYDDSTTAAGNYVTLVLRRRYGGRVTDPWRFVAHQIAA